MLKLSACTACVFLIGYIMVQNAKYQARAERARLRRQRIKGLKK